MRFNEKRTCLDFLDRGVPDDLILTKSSWNLGRLMQTKHDVIENFPKLNKLLNFGQKVQYVTIPFYEAFQKSAEKVFKALENEPLFATGTFIIQVDAGITKTVFYHINREPNTQLFHAVFMSFTKGFGMVAMDFMCQYKPTSGKEEDGVDVNYFLGETYDKLNVGYRNIIAEWMGIIGFLKYCEIETKVLTPKEKFKKMGVRYFNEEKQNIEILDCAWFTNLVVSGAFNVSGHLRWQPRKENGEWTKRLIWINEFQKEGYTRKAKAITDDTHTNKT